MKAVAVHRPLDVSTVSYWALILSVLFPSMHVLGVQVTTFSSSSSSSSSSNTPRLYASPQDHPKEPISRHRSTTTYSLTVFLESPAFEPFSLSLLSSSPPITPNVDAKKMTPSGEQISQVHTKARVTRHSDNTKRSKRPRPAKESEHSNEKVCERGRSTRRAKAARRVFVREGGKSPTHLIYLDDEEPFNGNQDTSNDDVPQDISSTTTITTTTTISTATTNTQTVRVLVDDKGPSDFESFVKSSSISTTTWNKAEYELAQTLWTYWKKDMAMAMATTSQCPHPHVVKEDPVVSPSASTSPPLTSSSSSSSEGCTKDISPIWQGQVNGTNWNMSSTGTLLSLGKDTISVGSYSIFYVDIVVVRFIMMGFRCDPMGLSGC